MEKQQLIERFKDQRLGETTERLALNSRDENRIVTVQMLEQARRSINITSRSLDPAIYDHKDFLDAARQFALSSPGVRMRILVNDAEPVIKQGHRLLELARKLTSFIEIRVQGKTFHEYNEAWLLVDETGYVHRRLADRFEAEAGFNAPRQVRDMNKQFEEMWQESVTDPNLRRLHI
ncbi:MAG: hypothetical protein PVF75_10970 [Granulosicoccaceae bacterium]|jgi:hypothetical protein